MTAKEPEMGEMRQAFHSVVQMLRRSQGLTIDALAKKTGIDRTELAALERNPLHRPSPLTLHRLSKFFGLPDRKLAVLAGAIRDVPEGFRQHAARFAAESD